MGGEGYEGYGREPGDFLITSVVTAALFAVVTSF